MCAEKCKYFTDCPGAEHNTGITYHREKKTNLFLKENKKFPP